ncbi:MAG: SDR family oxidoreductase [Candidatus Obscuribacterales bacterium]|nr:SDR family oxidoreductase [Candidatus Obscuribacterales bacterium]
MDLKDKSILVLGATSSIARALAEELAKQGAHVHVAGRTPTEIERIANDLSVRYQQQSTAHSFQASDFKSHETLLIQVESKNGKHGLDGLVVAFGELGDQIEAQSEFEQAKSIIDSNFTGAVSILTHAANHFEKQGHGFIIGIASVAGDRGRQSNYIYGSAKGAFALFLQGLRNRLCKSGVQVLTVKPGFVDTKMTYGRQGMFLVASPEAVAQDIVKALKANKQVVYTPWFWQWIMLIIKTIPEPIFMKMKM